MGVGGLPNGAGGGRVVVEVHTHTRLLGALAGEDIHSRGLLNLSGTLENLLTALVGGGDLDDKVTRTHAGVLDACLELIARQDHADEGDIVPGSCKNNDLMKKGHDLRDNAVGTTLRSDGLDIAARGSAGPHTMSDGGRRTREVGSKG